MTDYIKEPRKRCSNCYFYSKLIVQKAIYPRILDRAVGFRLRDFLQESFWRQESRLNGLAVTGILLMIGSRSMNSFLSGDQ